jgi:hypothetical protein
MDLSESILARSDQQNFDDYVGGAKVVTVSEVRGGSNEQPVEIHLVEFPGKPYKPSKTMRRVLVFAWGSDSSAYIGRRLRLYGDPDVKFGGKTVGGIKIGAMSNIDQSFTLNLTETRAVKKPHTVEPLPAGPPLITEDTVADLLRAIAEATTTDELANVAADIKAWDLGAHKQALQTAWADRSKAIKQQGADQ